MEQKIVEQLGRGNTIRFGRAIVVFIRMVTTYNAKFAGRLPRSVALFRRQPRLYVADLIQSTSRGDKMSECIRGMTKREALSRRNSSGNTEAGRQVASENP